MNNLRKNLNIIKNKIFGTRFKEYKAPRIYKVVNKFAFVGKDLYYDPYRKL